MLRDSSDAFGMVTSQTILDFDLLYRSFMLKNRIIATLQFFDLQNFPLTLLELHKYLLSDVNELQKKIDQNFEIGSSDPQPHAEVSIEELLRSLSNECVGQVVSKQGFYCLSNRQNIITSRLSNYRYGIFRERRIRKYLRFLRFLPFIRGVAVGGSQALGQQKDSSDIDLFIITDQKFLWTARIFITAYFQMVGVRRHGKKIKDRFCLNHYLTESHETGQHKDLYNAMEYLRLRPVVYGSAITEFQKANLGWLLQFFPNFKHQQYPEEPQTFTQELVEKIFENSLGVKLEAFLGQWQLRRIQRGEFVVASPLELSFHSVKRKKDFLARFFEVASGSL